MKEFILTKRLSALALIATSTSVGLLFSTEAHAAIFNLTIQGSDAIFLAGRTDITIPSASEPWDILGRHGGPTPEEIKETIPPFISVNPGDIIRVADAAIGGVSFFNGFGAPFFGPEGNLGGSSNLQSLGGISGYKGTQGPLVGVFLDNSIPSSSPAPATLDFTPGGSGPGIEFSSLSPELRQIFYIGDGVRNKGEFQEFTAPTGATRLFLGIPDGFGFVGTPGAYDDNDGSYQVNIGTNQIPVDVPEPGTLAGLAMFGLSFLVKKKLSNAA